MPRFKLAKLGVWEAGEFIGAVIFAQGATPNLCRPYDLGMLEVTELVRVALRDHLTPTTKIVSLAIKKIRELNPGLRLIVSFADSGEGHLGIIYQAGNWIYLGESKTSWVRLNGKVEHPRTLVGKFGTCSIGWLRQHIDPLATSERMMPKYRYGMPLDKGIRRRLTKMSHAYPKRPANGALPAPPEAGGSSPTRTLQSSDGGG